MTGLIERLSHEICGTKPGTALCGSKIVRTHSTYSPKMLCVVCEELSLLVETGVMCPICGQACKDSVEHQ